MTPTVLWSVLAAIVVLAIGIAVAAAKARARARARAAAAGAREVHPVDRECAGLGHVYRPHGTGLRCLRCGNYVARIEGELYGGAEDGRIDRRREPR
jgi:hypothetical protein